MEITHARTWEESLVFFSCFSLSSVRNKLRRCSLEVIQGGGGGGGEWKPACVHGRCRRLWLRMHLLLRLLGILPRSGWRHRTLRLGSLSSHRPGFQISVRSNKGAFCFVRRLPLPRAASILHHYIVCVFLS